MEQTQLGVQSFPSFPLFTGGQLKTKQHTHTHTHTHPPPKLDFPESLAAGRCLSDIVLANKMQVAGRGSPTDSLAC